MLQCQGGLIQTQLTKHLSVAPSQFHWLKYSTNSHLTICVCIQSIPKISKASSAVNSDKWHCSRSLRIGPLFNFKAKVLSQPSASHYPLPSFARTAFTTTLLHATEHPVAIPSACSMLIFFPVPARLSPLPSLGCHHSLSTAAYADVTK